MEPLQIAKELSGLIDPLTLERLRTDYLRAVTAAARGVPLPMPIRVSAKRYDELVAEGLLQPTDDNPNTAHPVEQRTGSLVESIVVHKQRYMPE
jgi:hypothetical protein